MDKTVKGTLLLKGRRTSFNGRIIVVEGGLSDSELNDLGFLRQLASETNRVRASILDFYLGKHPKFARDLAREAREHEGESDTEFSDYEDREVLKRKL